MARTLDFIQIYFEDDQVKELYPFAIPYKNETLTPYFECDVISKVVPECKGDLISVNSWRLKRKRADLHRLPDKGLTEEKILNADFDIAVLTPRKADHPMLELASGWHGKAWDDAFSVWKPFLKSIGINVPNEIYGAIYENAFIAKAEIYKEYVEKALKPSIAFMDGEPVFSADSGYIKKKKDPREIKSYQEKSGRQDWPIAPFLLERLFRIYTHDKGYKQIIL